MRPPLLIIDHLDAQGRHGLASSLRAAEIVGAEPLPVVTAFAHGPSEAPTALVPVASRTIVKQIDAALDREPVATLIGVISRPRHARLIAQALANRGPAAMVVAPIPGGFDIRPLVSQRLFPAIRRHLVPEARALVLPAPNASTLVGGQDETVDDLREIGRRIVELGAQTAWIRAADSLTRRVDVIVDANGSGLLDYDASNGSSAPHTAPAALAALLALGTKMRDAVERAHRHADTHNLPLHV